MEEEETLLDIQHSPLFKLKRKGLIMTLFLFYLLCGLEYSITIPSALLDGKYSQADRTFMLTEVGLYPLGAMLTSMLLGHIYDRTKRIRTILLTLAFLQIIGNFVYAMHVAKWFSLLGRFVSGLGDGFIAISVSEITYLYEDHNRIGMLCVLELGRVIGFMNGPVVNFFIVKWSKVHKWTLNNKSLPGYVMGCSWAVAMFIAFCCMHNLALDVIEKFNLNDSPFLQKRTRIFSAESNRYEDIKEMRDANGAKKEGNPFGSIEELSDSELSEPGEMENVDAFREKADDIFPIPEKKPPKVTLRQKVGSIFSTRWVREKVNDTYEGLKGKMSDNANEIVQNSHMREIAHIEIVLLMVMNFLCWFSQATFLMFCSYITTYEYNWSPTAIGATYVVGFVVVIAAFALMYVLREPIAKKNIYLVVIAMAFIEISLALLIYEGVPKDVHKRMAILIISAVLTFGSIPFTLVCFKTLVTSMVRPGMQGTLQGLSSSVIRLAVITGLLLSIVTVHGRQVYGAIMTVLFFVTIIFFFLSFNMVVRRQKEATMKLSY